MGFKKLTSSLLLLIFMCSSASPLTAATTKDETLYDFMQNTKDIKASYTYPSMKTSSNIEGTVKLPANTPVILKNRNTISTKFIVNGTSVPFTVADDVKDETGTVLIKAGTPASAKITFVEYKKAIGRSGEIQISDFHTTAVDGSYVPLSGTLSSNPDNRMVLSIVLSAVICPLFLLMEGREAEVSAGTTKTVYTAIDTHINTDINRRQL